MRSSGELVNKTALSKNVRTVAQPLAPGLVSAGIVCAFGLWSAPALLLVYLGLTSELLKVQVLFAILAMTGLSATGLRLLFGYLLKPAAQAGVLLVMLLVLLLLSALMSLMTFNTGLLVTAFPVLALLAGVGGGSIAILSGPVLVARGNIQYDLETTTILGHLSIVGGLLILPWLITLAFPGQPGWILLTDSSHFFGRIAAGAPVWPVWIGAFWGVLCAFTLGFWWLRRSWHQAGIWRHAARALAVLLLGLVLSLAGSRLLLAAAFERWPQPLGVGAVLLVPMLCVLALRLLLPVQRWRVLTVMWSQRQLWILSASWVATLGTFLGFTLAFPLLTAMLFHPSEQVGGPGYPGVFLCAWMLPLSALLMRPLGWWAARLWGGVRVARFGLVALTLAALSIAWQVYQVEQANYPPDYFVGYLLSFVVLFLASGVSHAALVQSLSVTFSASLREYASVWLMTMAALGMTYIPLVLAQQSGHGLPDAFVSFSVFYGLCVLLLGLPRSR